MHVARIVRATLLYNAKAGSAASEEMVRDALDKLGWKVDRLLSKKELDDLLVRGTEGADVIVVAGGDGTIGKAAKRLAGRPVPMAIVPMGTANNIARSLGLGVDPMIALQGLTNPIAARLDLGVVDHDGNRQYFIEAFGVGVFAEIIAEKASKKDKTLRRALELMASELDQYRAMPVQLEVDGVDLSGRYILAAVMNAQSLGPALCVAPDARCDDGRLEVVLVRPEHKESLLAHLVRAVEVGDICMPVFETLRASHVRLRADGRWAHVDDVPVRLGGPVTIDVAAGSVRLLAPSLSRVEEHAPSSATPPRVET